MARAAIPEIRVGLIGAGLIGRIHAHAYRSLGFLRRPLPATIRLAVVADENEPLAEEVAGQFGFERTATSWEAVAEARDVDVAIVALPNYEHRPVVEALVASGKHVLCEKPLAPSAADSWAMLQAARRAGVVHCVGFNLRRVPAIAAIKKALERGDFGETRQFISHYLTDYAADEDAPLAWRFKRELAGGGALADVGSHIIDIARFLLGDIESVHGSAMATFVHKRPIPAGHVIGHEKGMVTGDFGVVDTDDVASFTARFRSGTVGQFAVSRMATGHPISIGISLVGSTASATFDAQHMSEFGYFRASGDDDDTRGFRRVMTGPAHPYFEGFLACPMTGAGYGMSDTWVGQAYEFVGAVARGVPLSGGGFEDGYAVDLVREAAMLSAERGALVRIDEISAKVEGDVG